MTTMHFSELSERVLQSRFSDLTLIDSDLHVDAYFLVWFRVVAGGHSISGMGCIIALRSTEYWVAKSKLDIYSIYLLNSTSIYSRFRLEPTMSEARFSFFVCFRWYLLSCLSLSNNFYHGK